MHTASTPKLSVVAPTANCLVIVVDAPSTVDATVFVRLESGLTLRETAHSLDTARCTINQSSCCSSKLNSEGDDFLAEDPVILFVRSDPKPQDAIGRLHSDCSMRQANANGPVLTNTLEMKRWMVRICLQQLIVVTRELLKFGGEFVKGAPEAF